MEGPPEFPPPSPRLSGFRWSDASRLAISEFGAEDFVGGGRGLFGHPNATVMAAEFRKLQAENNHLQQALKSAVRAAAHWEARYRRVDKEGPTAVAAAMDPSLRSSAAEAHPGMGDINGETEYSLVKIMERLALLLEENVSEAETQFYKSQLKNLRANYDDALNRLAYLQTKLVTLQERVEASENPLVNQVAQSNSLIDFLGRIGGLEEANDNLIRLIQTERQETFQSVKQFEETKIEVRAVLESICNISGLERPAVLRSRLASFQDANSVPVLQMARHKVLSEKARSAALFERVTELEKEISELKRPPANNMAELRLSEQ